MVKRKTAINGKSGWKPVAIDPSVFNSTDFQGFLGIEELTNYSLKGHKTSKESKLITKTGKISKAQKTKNKFVKDKGTDETLKKLKLEPKKGKLVRKENGCKIGETNTKIKAEMKKGKEVREENGSNSGKKKSKKRRKGKHKSKTVSKGDYTKSGVNSLTCENSDGVDQESLPDDLSIQMADWNGLGVPPILLRALADKLFTTPTNIQALTLPAAIFGRRDILGAAETGSGKTLAFGLPILNGILEEMKKDATNNETESSDQNRIGQLDEDYTDEDDDVPDDEKMNEEDDDSKTLEGDENDSSEAEDAISDSEIAFDDDDKAESDHFDKTTQCVRVIDDVNFDFPLVEKIKSKSRYIQKPLYALVLTPTRELAVQISQHLRTAAKYTNISVAVLVGGLAVQKQERLLNHGPEIVVATPGRLWDLIEEGHPHLVQVDKLKYLAIDETDRMLEKGHFDELQRLLDKINENEEYRKKRQNFVFSATLTLTHEPPKYVLKKKNKKKQVQAESARLTPAQKLASIMETVGLTNPKVVDITQSSGVAQLLSEAQIICSLDEKDYYLYYFLQRHPGRTLVFCNSIEAVRRLSQLFTLLGCSPWPLHAKMHQKQRLKNLERFRDNPRGVLLATDVAARGLDIPNVQHVIHYQFPRTAEGYVHRSGRTARAHSEGLTVLLTEPSEVITQSQLFRSLGRDSNLPTFPIDQDLMPAVKERVNFARRVDKVDLQSRRVTKEHGWFDKLVKDMDMEVSDEELPTTFSRKGGNAMKKEAAALRKQLAALITKPLVPKGFASKYPTQTGKLIVPLFPGSIPPNKECYQETAVQALKHSVEEQKSFKRKMNNERAKRNKRRKRVKRGTTEDDEQDQSENDNEPYDGEENDGEEND